MNIDTTEILNGLIGVVMLAAIYFVKTYLAAKISAIKDEQVQALAKSAVLATEQMVVQSESGQKYAEAEKKLKALLAEKGIKVNDDAIKTIIEAQVRIMIASYNDRPATDAPDVECGSALK